MVLDGKFVSLDPYLGTNYHLLSDVKIQNLKLLRVITLNLKAIKNVL